MKFSKKYRYPAGKSIKLSSIATLDKKFGGLEESNFKRSMETGRTINNLQWKLHAEGKHSLLLVFQALDAAGKDGVIRHVCQWFNPQGVSTTGFKQPTAAELAHDFLWRIHPHTPGQGEIAIFNRSHYEDVLVTRVHSLVPKEVWKTRYEHINNFESLLHQDKGTVVLKFFLHMSPEVQLERFGERLKDPSKNWKISDSDYTERSYWPEYVSAYNDVLSKTSTKYAPWFVIPSDDKLSRNMIVAEIIREQMEALNLKYPAPSVDLDEIQKQYHADKKNPIKDDAVKSQRGKSNSKIAKKLSIKPANKSVSSKKIITSDDLSANTADENRSNSQKQ